MKLYNGGSDKDELLGYVTGYSKPSPITSLRNQMFIKFSSDGSGVGNGFTAKITFGTYLKISLMYYSYHILHIFICYIFIYLL